jgi:uncharacterized membrane protein
MGHWVAAGVGGVLAALAVTLGSRYNRAGDGWDIASGSNVAMLVMVLVLGPELALSFALLRPRPRNPHGARLISIVWTLAIFVALVFTWQVIATADRWLAEMGTAITSSRSSSTTMPCGTRSNPNNSRIRSISHSSCLSSSCW